MSLIALLHVNRFTYLFSTVVVEVDVDVGVETRCVTTANGESGAMTGMVTAVGTLTDLGRLVFFTSISL